MLRNTLPRINVIDDQQLQLLVDQTYRILEEIGHVYTLPEALDLLEALPGTQVDRDKQIVRMDRATVQWATRQCPNPFTLHARNPARSVQIGGDSVTFATVIGSPFVQDLKRGRRNGTLADFIELVKIAHMLPDIDVVDSGICEPQDVEVDARSLWRVYTSFKECDRALAGSTWDRGPEDSMAIADIVFGRHVDFPVFCTIMNGISPLAWDDRMCQSIIGYARRNQALIFACGPMGGFTGPVTYAGAMTLGFAEVLAGIVLAQAARPGAPVLFAGGGGPGNMKIGTGGGGSHGRLRASLISAQAARHWGLPIRSSGCVTGSKVGDFQAGWEKMLSMMSCILSGANHLVHSVGVLDRILCTSYEMMVADADIVGLAKGLMSREIEITPETLAFDVIKEVGPFGEFITHEHTFKHFREWLWEPVVADRSNWDEWVRRGSKTAEDRAYDRWNELLAKHEVAPLDRAAEREIQALIAAREGEIARVAAVAV
ncbi:MAG: trimethylamine methyltransferase family protein [Chloroflexi bacterium]|nr:trimethylamine methyltransferase family protein [Chloroflexota bacterium]